MSSNSQNNNDGGPPARSPNRNVGASPHFVQPRNPFAGPSQAAADLRAPGFFLPQAPAPPALQPRNPFAGPPQAAADLQASGFFLPQAPAPPDSAPLPLKALASLVALRMPESFLAQTSISELQSEFEDLENDKRDLSTLVSDKDEEIHKLEKTLKNAYELIMKKDMEIHTLRNQDH